LGGEKRKLAARLQATRVTKTAALRVQRAVHDAGDLGGDAVLFRCLSFVLLLLVVGSRCFAQEVTVRVINAVNGRPLEKQHVSVSLMYDGEMLPTRHYADLSQDTNANGEAHFTLPEPAPPHVWVQVRLTSDAWHCACAVIAATGAVVQKGIVRKIAGESNKAAASLKAAPGEILFAAHPYSFLERLLYPLAKG
jgi:hypothetical protein